MLHRGERGFSFLDFYIEDGQYLKASSAVGYQGAVREIRTRLGDVAGPEQAPDWDLADTELGGLETRVGTNTLLLNFSLATRFDIASSSAPPLLKSMALISMRNSWWALPHRGFTFVFSAASAFQRWLTPSHDVVTYLLSPFSDVAVDCRVEGASFFCWLATSQPFRKSEPNIHRLIKKPTAMFLCIAYWLGIDEHRSELAELSASVEFGKELRFPMHDVLLPTSLRGIRVGKTIYVQRFIASKDSRWPLVFRKLSFIQARRASGVEMTLDQAVERPDELYQCIRSTLDGKKTAKIRSMFETAQKV